MTVLAGGRMKVHYGAFIRALRKNLMPTGPSPNDTLSRNGCGDQAGQESQCGREEWALTPSNVGDSSPGHSFP